MENIESPPIVPTNPLKITGRNILKELNSLDGIRNSVKLTPLSDEPASQTRKNLPDIVTTIHSNLDPDGFIGSPQSKVASNSNLLRAATPDEHQSEDELFFDCNSTLKENSPNMTNESASGILDRTIEILEQLVPSESAAETHLNNENTVATREELCDNRLINVTESVADNSKNDCSQTSNMKIDVESENPNTIEHQTTVQNISLDFDQLTSLLGGLKICTSSDTVPQLLSDFSVNQYQKTDSKSNFDSKVEASELKNIVDVSSAESLDLKLDESSKLNETIDVAATLDTQPQQVESKELNETVDAAAAVNTHPQQVEPNELNETVDTMCAVSQHEEINSDPMLDSTDESNELNTTVDIAAAVSTHQQVESNELNETVDIAAAVSTHPRPIESNQLNETVDIAVAVSQHQEIHSEPIHDSTVESNEFNTTVDIAAAPQVESNELNKTVDIAAAVSTHSQQIESNDFNEIVDIVCTVNKHHEILSEPIIDSTVKSNELNTTVDIAADLNTHPQRGESNEFNETVDIAAVVSSPAQQVESNDSTAEENELSVTVVVASSVITHAQPLELNKLNKTVDGASAVGSDSQQDESVDVVYATNQFQEIDVDPIRDFEVEFIKTVDIPSNISCHIQLLKSDELNENIDVYSTNITPPQLLESNEFNETVDIAAAVSTHPQQIEPNELNETVDVAAAVSIHSQQFESNELNETVDTMCAVNQHQEINSEPMLDSTVESNEMNITVDIAAAVSTQPQVESNELNETVDIAVAVSQHQEIHSEPFHDSTVESNEFNINVDIAAAVSTHPQVESNELNETVDIATAVSTHSQQIESNELNEIVDIVCTVNKHHEILSEPINDSTVKSNELNTTADIAADLSTHLQRGESNEFNETVDIAAVVSSPAQQVESNDSTAEENELNVTVDVAPSVITHAQPLELNKLNKTVDGASAVGSDSQQDESVDVVYATNQFQEIDVDPIRDFEVEFIKTVDIPSTISCHIQLLKSDELNENIDVASTNITPPQLLESNEFNETVDVAAAVSTHPQQIEPNEFNETVDVAAAVSIHSQQFESNELNETVDIAADLSTHPQRGESNEFNETVDIAAAVSTQPQVESNELNETVDIVCTVNKHHEILSEPINDSTVKSNELNTTVDIAADLSTHPQRGETNEFNETVDIAAVVSSPAQQVESNDSTAEENELNVTVDVAPSVITHAQPLELNKLNKTVDGASAVGSDSQQDESVDVVYATNQFQEIDVDPIRDFEVEFIKTVDIPSTISSHIQLLKSDELNENIEVASTNITPPQLLESSELNETADIVRAVNQQQETDSKSIHDSRVDSNELNKTVDVKSNTNQYQEIDSKQNQAFRMKLDETVVIGSTDSLQLGQDNEAAASIGNDPESCEFTELKQSEKIYGFKIGLSISVDSLDEDRIEVNQPLQPVVPNENILTSDTSTIPDGFAINDVELTTDAKKSILDCSLTEEITNAAMPLKLESVHNSNQPDFIFKAPVQPNSKLLKMHSHRFPEGDNSNFMVLNSNDFDFLQSRGGGLVDAEDDRRSSLLLRFDPLLKNSSVATPFAPVVQEVEEGAEVDDTLIDSKAIVESATNTSGENSSDEQGFPAAAKPFSSNEAAMSVGLVRNTNSMENEAKAFVNNIKAEKTDDSVPVADKKIKFEYTEESIQKRMQEYEATQEILLKRITEKDKAIAKTSNVLELYEKAIAEVLAAKEKLAQSYDKTHEELKTDRDLNNQHLMSLESTFSDLYMKFERNIEYTTQLQEKLNALIEEKVKCEELLNQQEARYDKLTTHALNQFEIANQKLDQQTRNFSGENTKLRAQIKREEIYKNAVQEELFQKKKENEELVKICDELISGQKS